MAANKIDVNFVKQFGNTLDLLTQTKGGKFEGKCLTDTIEGTEKYYDQLSSVTAETADRSSESSGSNTFANSPDNFIEHKRRKVTATAYDIGLMLDRFDKVEMLVNPESQYVQQMVHALNRKKDIEFLKGALGTAYSGVSGGTSENLGGGQIITKNELASGTAAAKLTLDKIIEARKTLEAAGVDLDDPSNKAYLGITPNNLHNLLTEEKVTSGDYAAIKALVRGELNSFYGFEFCVSNLIPFMNAGETAVNLAWNSDGSHDGTAAGDKPKPPAADDKTRACFAWVHSGVRQVTNPAIETEITKRADKRFNWYAYAAMRTGAVRMEEEKVVVIACDE